MRSLTAWPMLCRAAAAAAEGLCKWKGCADAAHAQPGGFCASSMANCITDCGGTWCPRQPGYEGVLPWEEWLLGRAPQVTGSHDIRAASGEDSGPGGADAAPDQGTASMQLQIEPAAGAQDAPAPAPAAPQSQPPRAAPAEADSVFGYCNWSGCNGERQGSEWCGAGVDNCVFTCGGSWCWEAPTRDAIEAAPPAGDADASDLAASSTVSASSAEATSDSINSAAASQDSEEAVDLPESAQHEDATLAGKGSAPLAPYPQTGGKDTIISLNADEVARWLGIEADRIGHLVAVLEGIPNVRVLRSGSGSQSADSGN